MHSVHAMNYFVKWLYLERRKQREGGAVLNIYFFQVRERIRMLMMVTGKEEEVEGERMVASP